MLAVPLLAALLLGPARAAGLRCDWRAQKALARAEYEAWVGQFDGAAWSDQERRDARRIAAETMALAAASEHKVLGRRARADADDGERAAAARRLCDLRLCYLYGNLLVRVLDDADATVRWRAVLPLRRPGPVLAEDDYRAEEERLSAQVGSWEDPFFKKAP